MAAHVDELESRRLMAGGIDERFETSGGTNYVPPGRNAQVLDTAIDAEGRTLIVGTMSRTIRRQAREVMFLARLGRDGVRDVRFGVGGEVIGAPLGVTRIDHLAPVEDGGYVAVGKTGDGGTRVIRFDGRGRLDRSFGKHGRVHVGTFSSKEILQQGDGKLLLVGNATPRDPDENPLSINYAVRMDQSGQLDTSHGEAGWRRLSVASEWDDEVFVGSDVVTATLDSQDRLLLATSDNRGIEGYQGSSFSGTVSVGVYRYHASGKDDLSRGSFYSDDYDIDRSDEADEANDDPSLPHDAIAVTRPDGRVVVVHQSEDVNDRRPIVRLMKNDGTLEAVNLDIASQVPSFQIPKMAVTSIEVLSDNALLIAGTTDGSGEDPRPVVLKLTPELALDTKFADGGVLAVPSGAGTPTAVNVFEHLDGSAYVAVTESGLSDVGGASGDRVRVSRLFVDDRPVVSLASVKTSENHLRLTVSITGPNALDPQSLSDDDLRLFDSTGSSQRLLRSGSRSINGETFATYAIRTDRLNPDETYDVGLLKGRITDTEGNGSRRRVIGRIAGNRLD